MRLKSKAQSAKRTLQTTGGRAAQKTKNTLQTTGRQAEHGTRNPSIRRGGQLGFSLIEVMVALIILAIGFLGVSLMQVMSISGNTFSKEMVVATELGQDMLEKLKTMEYSTTTTNNALLATGNHPDSTDVADNLAPVSDTDGVPCTCNDAPCIKGTDNIVDERGLQVGPLVYMRTWAVTDNTPATDTKEIAVTVGWMEKGACRSVTITGVKVKS